jgi:hypothetical protein
MVLWEAGGKTYKPRPRPERSYVSRLINPDPVIAQDGTEMCSATTRKGLPCKVPAQVGGLCFSHEASRVARANRERAGVV